MHMEMMKRDKKGRLKIIDLLIFYNIFDYFLFKLFIEIM